MGVVRRAETMGSWICFLLSLSMTAASPAPIHDPGSGKVPQHAVLRIYLSQQSDFFIGGKLIADGKINEVAEFRGLFLSRDGYVVSYVGNYLPELSFPEVKTTIETWDGDRLDAELIAVDERLALMFLKTEMKCEAVHLSAQDNPAHFSIVSFGKGDWQTGHSCLYSAQKKPLLPTYKMKVSGLSVEAANWQGGPVFDLTGALVGLVTDVMPHLTSKNLSYFYMIPALALEASLGRVLQDKGHTLAGWLGVNIDDSGEYLVVSRVVPNSPAEWSGLQVADRLLKLNDIVMENLTEFSQAIRWMEPDKTCQVTIERRGRISQVEIQLSARQKENLGWRVAMLPGEQGKDGDARMRIYRTRVPPLLEFGLVLERLTSRAAGEMAALSQGALLVQQVRAGSQAQQVGLRVGDIIFRVNDHYVSSVEDVQSAILDAQNSVPIGLVRDGKKMSLTIQIHK